MKLKKIISLITATSILALSLASCANATTESNTPKGLIDNANKKLERLDHTVEVKVDYNAKEQEINSLFDELENVDTKLLFDGDSISIENNTTMNTVAGETTFFNNCVLIDGMAYANSGYRTPQGGNSNNLKVEITDEQKQTLVEKAGLIIGIGIDDFETVTLDKQGEEYYVICTNATVDLNIQLEKLLISQLQNSADSVGVKNACMTVEIEDGKFDTVTVKCDYSVVLKGTTYSVEAEYELEYDYDEKLSVKAPSNANEYSYSEFDKILNTL